MTILFVRTACGGKVYATRYRDYGVRQTKLLIAKSQTY